MILIGQIQTFGTSSNFVHLVVACVVAWGFVAGHVATWGIATVRREREAR